MKSLCQSICVSLTLACVAHAASPEDALTLSNGFERLAAAVGGFAWHQYYTVDHVRTFRAALAAHRLPRWMTEVAQDATPKRGDEMPVTDHEGLKVTINMLRRMAADFTDFRVNYWFFWRGWHSTGGLVGSRATLWLTTAAETLAAQSGRAIQDGVLSGGPLTLPPLSVQLVVAEPQFIIPNHHDGHDPEACHHGCGVCARGTCRAGLRCITGPVHTRHDLAGRPAAGFCRQCLRPASRAPLVWQDAAADRSLAVMCSTFVSVAEPPVRIDKKKRTLMLRGIS